MSEIEKVELEVARLDLKIKRIWFQILNWVLGTLRGKHPQVKFYIGPCLGAFGVIVGLIVRK